jgi:hypothetical protein
MKKSIRHQLKNLIAHYCTNDHHWIAFLISLIFGITAIVTGIVTKTIHNVIIGLMIVIFGRIYLTADANTENPLEA